MLASLTVQELSPEPIVWLCPFVPMYSHRNESSGQEEGDQQCMRT